MADDSSQNAHGTKNKDRRVAKDQVKRLGGIRDEIKDLDKSEIINVTDIKRMMDQTNAVNGADAKMTRVAIADAQVNCDVSKLGLKSIKARNAGQQQFKAKEFVSKMLAMFESNSADDDDAGCVRIEWDKVRVEACKFYDATPSCHFVAGDMSKQVAKKEKKKRQVNSQRRAEEETQPIYGADEGAAVKKNSEKRKRQLMEQLKSDKKIVMADFVVNPKSFGETVENLFACGVMVSEGYAAVQLAKDSPADRLIISSSAPPPDEAKIDDKRAIIKLDFEMFERMVKQRKLEEAHFKFNVEAEDATIELEEDEEAAQSAAQTQRAGGASGSKKRRSS